jgi:hypothetical protein
MERRKNWMAGGAVVLFVLGGGTSIAIATGVGDDDTPLTGTDLENATQAALEHTGGGTVMETEAGDGGAAYGVEVRLDDGSVVEVELDEHFDVIGEGSDDDGADEQQEGNESVDDD